MFRGRSIQAEGESERSGMIYAKQQEEAAPRGGAKFSSKDHLGSGNLD